MRIPTGPERTQATMMIAGALVIADVAARGLRPTTITTETYHDFREQRIQDAIDLAMSMLEAVDRIIQPPGTP